jgi:hypothetical protein
VTGDRIVSPQSSKSNSSSGSFIEGKIMSLLSPVIISGII